MEVARGMLRSFYTRDCDGILRWKQVGEEAGALLREDAVDEDRDHGVEFVSAFATFVAAELLAAEHSETLDGLVRWSAPDPSAQRALDLLLSPGSLGGNARVRRGHVYTHRPLERALIVEPMDWVWRSVTTADHPLFRAVLAPWIPIVGLSLALRGTGPERQKRLWQFLTTWDVGQARDIVFERQRPAPVPGDPDDWTEDYASRNVAFSDAAFRGFDAVEISAEGAICHHYIEAIWQTPDVDWPDPANAFWFLSEGDLEQGCRGRAARLGGDVAPNL